MNNFIYDAEKRNQARSDLRIIMGRTGLPLLLAAFADITEEQADQFEAKGRNPASITLWRLAEDTLRLLVDATEPLRGMDL